MELTGVATCGFGLESVMGFELKRIGMQDVRMQDGRAVFHTDEYGIARANIWLRTAERVQILLAEFECSSFDDLFDGVSAVELGRYIGRTDAFPVKGYCMNSKLTSVPACQSVAKKAAVESLKAYYDSPFLTEKSGVTKMLRFSIVKDRCSLM
ncbi:MAG: class I SAM-dependent RNA methyltransferase, partial [Oscillospiraceae bacterium]|nr:class I SAM-dependent RNA methyltransferase [Oscillospiraceae bacterium]